MYNQPIYEPNLVAGFDFTVSPPVDTTGKHTDIQLLNGAVIDELIIPIDPTSDESYLGFIQSTNAVYFSEHHMPSGPPLQHGVSIDWYQAKRAASISGCGVNRSTCERSDP